MSQHTDVLSAEAETHSLFVQTILMLTLMVSSLLFINVLKMKHFHAISETTTFVLIGLFVGCVLVLSRSLAEVGDKMNSDIQLSSNFFYMVLLPPIIFEGGFTLQRVAFVRNLIPILALALLGGAYSTIVTSLFMYGFSRLIYPTFSLTHALIFGSIISSTDPVSVLGMLPPSTDRNLYMLIFGESALNDAVSIILFRFFTAMAEIETETDGITPGKFFLAILNSVWVFFGSAAIGTFIALLFAKLTKHVKAPEAAPIFELLMFLVFAYCSYLITDVLGFTGIIGIFFCGVAMAHYAYDNLSKVTLLSAKVVLRTFSSMCDAFVFLYLGLGLTAFGKAQTTYNPAFIIVAILTILFSRTHVFIIGFVNNFFAKVSHNSHRLIPMNHQIFLWFCGLRGAVAFALSVQLLSNLSLPMDIRALMFGTTVMVVFFTVVLLGGLVPFVMKRLKLDAAGQQELAAGELAKKAAAKDVEAPEPTSAEHVIKTAKTAPGGHLRKQGSMTTLDEYMAPQNSSDAQAGESAEEAAAFMDAIDSGFWWKLYEWDKRYIKPFFSADPRRTLRKGNVLYDTSAVRTHGENRGSNDRVGSADDVYEIRNTNLVSALDDDDDDELDRVSIAQAAEMIGIAGSTANFSKSALYSSPGGNNSQHLRSRSNSITSLNSIAAKGRQNAMRKNAVEMQPISPRGKASVRSDAAVVPPTTHEEDEEATTELDNAQFEISGHQGFGAATIRPPPSANRQPSAGSLNLSLKNASRAPDADSLPEEDDDDADSFFQDNDDKKLISRK